MSTAPFSYDPADARQTMSGPELSELTTFVRTKMGIVMHEHLQKKLFETLIKGSAAFTDGNRTAFVQRLYETGPNDPEWEFLAANVTIDESYFFRDDGQIAFLRDQWLPRLLEQKKRSGQSELRIWSAGCSNGQEPYTLAMLLHQLGADAADWTIRILGTDINTDALKTAVSGRYSQWSLRATPKAIRDRYFISEGDGIRVNPDIRSMVRFGYLNLVSDSFPSLLNETAHLDLILCRNVFIYFDRATCARIVTKFSSCLVPGGALIIGASDPAAIEVDDLRYTAFDGGGYYEKDTNIPKFGRSRHVSRPAVEKVSLRPSLERLSPSPSPLPARKSEPPMPAPVATETASVPAEGLSSAVIEHIRAKDFESAIELIEEAEQRTPQAINEDILRSKIKILANLGRRSEARGVCEELLGQGKTDKHNHFVLGLVCLDENDYAGAETAFSRCLFLDRNFVEAHYHLGLVHLNQKRREAGMRSLKNALNIAESLPPDRMIHEAEGMTMERMRAVIRNWIEVFEKKGKE